MAAVLFLHVGWAREYLGADDDPPLGDFGYIKAGNEDSGEALNFKSYRGRLYGYAPAHAINLSRLGGSADDEYLDGILVIWTATEPVSKGRYIVGWYRNAKVYANITERRPDNLRPGIVAEARVRDTHLVPVDERTFWLPRMKKGWPGQYSAFYASDTLSDEYLTVVRSYVDGQPSIGFYDLFNGAETGQGQTHPGNGRGHPPVDAAKNAEVEKAAVDLVTAHYVAHGWAVQSVETDNAGWDLEATQGGRKLLIEVKGRDGQGSVELTPNEYAAMTNRKLRMSYRLAVAWNARSATPRLIIFEYLPASKTWVSPCSVVLEIEEKIGAVVSLTPPTVQRRAVVAHSRRTTVIR
jgi:hypothetical protein